jgi:hypothetical protein
MSSTTAQVRESTQQQLPQQLQLLRKEGVHDSNSHVKYNSPGRREYTTATLTSSTNDQAGRSAQQQLLHLVQLPR